MYQDTDYGRDVLAGAQAQAEAMGLKLGGTTGHKPTDTDFNGAVAKLREANCDLIVLGTIVKDTVIILQTAHKQGWNPIFMGNFATYSTAVAEAPGAPAEGFYLDVAGAVSLSRRSAAGGARVRRPNSSRSTASTRTTWARPATPPRTSASRRWRRPAVI